MCQPDHISWVGTGKAHCSRCCQTFSTVGNFDRHRERGLCLQPAEAGLKLNTYGVWIQEGEVDYDKLFKRK